MLYNPSGEEVIPNVQSKHARAQPEVICSSTIACYLGVLVLVSTHAFQFLITVTPVQVLTKAQENPYQCFTSWHKLFRNFSPDPCSNFPCNFYGKVIESVTTLFTHTSIKIMFFLLAFLTEKPRAC